MPNTVVVAVDTGPLVALFDNTDQHHARALQFVATCDTPMFTTLASVTEAMHLLRFDQIAQRGLMQWILSRGITIKHPSTEDLARAEQLLQKSSDLPMDFADALLVALCERLNIREIATADSDFEIYRFKGRGRFVNLF